MASPKNASTPAPFTRWQFALGTFAVAVASFMNVLDSSIANVAIPTLAGDLGVSVDEGTWVITLYATPNAVAIPLTEWLTQRVGQVKLLVVAILLFVVSFTMCSLAPNLPILLVARVIQGAMAGPLVPLSQVKRRQGRSDSECSPVQLLGNQQPIRLVVLARWERVDAAKSVRVTDSMFMAAAQGIASAPSAYINAGINLLPPVTALRDIAVSVSLAVALQAHKKVPSSGLSPDQTKGLIRGKVWAPHYVPWRKIKSSAI